MFKKILLIIIAISLAGCINKPPIQNNNQPQQPAKLVLPLNDYLCIKETGINTQEATVYRDLAREFIKYLKNQNYDNLKPSLTSALQKRLDEEDIKTNGLNVFYPESGTILPRIDNFIVKVLYKVQTNPKSTLIQGVCQADKVNLANNMFFKLNNPNEEQVIVYITGFRDTTQANAILLLNKDGVQWKIQYISIFPGDIAGKELYTLYQLAAQAEKEGRSNLAYLLYKLMLSITPKTSILPEYIIKAYQSLGTLKVSVPEKEKQNPQEWPVSESDTLLVYDLKAMAVLDKIVLFVGYISESEDTNTNDAESTMLKDYIKKTYPDLSYFFTILITEATKEVPETEDYINYRKLQKF